MNEQVLSKYFVSFEDEFYLIRRDVVNSVYILYTNSNKTKKKPCRIKKQKKIVFNKL